MSVEMLLVKQANDLTPVDVETWKALTLRLIDGMNAQHKARWRRFLAWALRAGTGEYLSWFMHRQRSTPFHRRHFALEQRLFDAQERFEEFDTMRSWLKIGAGFVVWAPGGPGMPAIVAVPKSMSYVDLDEDGMQELHVAMVRFMRSPRCTKCLWPHLKEPARDRMIESVLNEFQE